MRTIFLAAIPILMIAVAPTGSQADALAPRSAPGLDLWSPGRWVL